MEQQLQKLTQAILERGELIKQLQIQCEAIQASVEEMKPVRPEVKTEIKPAAPVAADSTPISAVTIDSTKLTTAMPYACSTLCSNHDVDVLTPASPVTGAVSSSPLSEGTSSLAPMVAAPPAASSSFPIGDAALDVAMSTAIGCTTTTLTRCLTPCPTHDADASSSPSPPIGATSTLLLLEATSMLVPTFAALPSASIPTSSAIVVLHGAVACSDDETHDHKVVWTVQRVPLPLLMQGVERSPWPPPSQLESGGSRAEPRPTPRPSLGYRQSWMQLKPPWLLPAEVNGLWVNCKQDRGQWFFPWPPPRGNVVVLPVFTKLAGRRAELSLGYCDSGECSVVYHNFAKNNFGGHLTSLPFSADRFGNKTLYAFLVDHNNFTGSLDAILLEQCGNLNGLIVSFRDNKISGGLTAEISTKSRAIRFLDLAGNQISGVMPANIGLLVALVNMDISRNLLEGQIPASFKDFKSLKFLSLAGNNLSGHIPSCLGQLRSLEVLDLSSNSLSGNIPSSLVTLKDLTALLLNNNKLSGNISNLTPLASLSIFNISFNNFSGPLPSNIHSLACNSTHENSSLQPCRLSTVSNPLMNVRVLTETDVNPTPDNTPTDGGGGFSKIEIASITSASAIVAVLLALIILYIYTRKCASRSSRRSLRREVTVFVDIGAPLTYETVVRATGSFNASNCIGSGGFGATYKAEIAPGVLVAIKRLAIGRFQGIQQFQAEVKTLGRYRHANLVTLIGYHLSDSEMFLIYNFLPGGNLERFIQERTKRPIDWRMLHKIALDIARALAYLHDNCVPRILHRDVKPSNILLDNEYNAYLSDFGLARLLGNSETHATTGVAGTFGYVAPEYAMTCRVSDKADVYSYGVVLLELISDKKALDPSFSPYGNGFNIVAWACMLLQKGRAREFFIEGLWDAAPHDDLVEILHLGIKCTVDSLSSRPTMKQVVRRLKELRPPSY